MCLIKCGMSSTVVTKYKSDKTWDLIATVPLTLSGNFNTEISVSVKSPTFHPGYLALRNE